MPLGNQTTAIKTRIAKWNSFYDLSSDQRYLLVIDDSDYAPKRPWPNPEARQARIEWGWQAYERRLKALDWLDDDRIPFLDVFTGTEIFAEAFGCRVERPSDNMPYALPRVMNHREAGKLRVPDISESPLALLFDIADELKARAGGAGIMHLPDIQSPFDIAALIWEKSDFYKTLIDSPDAVHELAHKVLELQINFLEEWFSRYGSEFIAHYPDYYMSDGLTLSIDEVGAISAAMFEEFFLSELKQLQEKFGQLGIHCCANSKHQWGGFKQIPNLILLNLVQPQPRLVEATSYFAHTCAQMHNWESIPQDPHALPGHHILTPKARDPLEARRIADQFRKNFN